MRSKEAAVSSVDPALHLLRRATFGPTKPLLAKVKSMGTTAWLDAQLSPSSISDSATDAVVARWPRLGYRTWEIREKLPVGSKYDGMSDLLRAHLSRALWSERQLFEMAVDFWTNHLVIRVPSSEVWDNAHLYQRDVIRKYAFGKYADMLSACIRHPAMLMTLGNAFSAKKSPNENHGRELLELHTVGVGNYTETDVKQSALALTGLSADRDNGLYQYKPERRHVGALQVLDWKNPNSSPEGGEAVAVSYVSYLARHPATAKRIVTKLAVRFVSDNPPSSLIGMLAKVYLDNDTAIVPVLRALFTSTEFASSVGQKTRTPYEDALASMRILGVQPEPSGGVELANLSFLLGGMGQAPMGWPAPNGYPDVAAYWSSAGSSLARWNFHMNLTAGWALKAMPRPDLSTLLPSTAPATYGAYVDALAASLLIDVLSTDQRVAVCRFLDHAPTDALKSTDSALGWRLPYVVALLLDTPNFWTR